jgi:hypothetical protein
VSRRLRSLTPLAEAVIVVAAAHVSAFRAVLPVLGLLTGPLGYVLLALGGAVAAQRTFSWPRLRKPPGWVLFVLAALLCSTIAVRYVRAVAPSGDEIDYLMLTQSVWREGDLDLRDNFARGDFLEYLSGFDRMPGGVHRHGRYYPIHSGGLPVLGAPVYAFFGRPGCAVLLALIAAGAAVLVWDIARRLIGDEEAALVAWAATIGPPVFCYTAFFYAEVPVAFCIALAFHRILFARRVIDGVVAALALSAMPWLHLRMALASAAIGVFALLRLRGRARVAFLAIGLAMGAAFVWYQFVSYESLSPYAHYGGHPPVFVVNRTPSRTLVGIFVDGGFGLLPHAPVFLLAFAGALAFARPRRQRDAGDPETPRPGWGLGVLLGIAAILGPTLSWRAWWGFSPPARFMVPLVPMLSLLAAFRVGVCPDRGLARWRWPLVALGLGFAVFLFAKPQEMRMINMRSGTARTFDSVAGTVSLSRYLPFLSARTGSTAPPWEPPATEAPVAGVWLAAIALLLLLDRLARTRERVDRCFRSLFLPLGLLLAVSLAVDHWARPPARSGSRSPGSNVPAGTSSATGGDGPVVGVARGAAPESDAPGLPLSWAVEHGMMRFRVAPLPLYSILELRQ